MSMQLRRAFESAEGGTWGSEPGDDAFDVACIRGTDFNITSLRVDASRLPIRSISAADWTRRRLRAGDIVIEKSGGGEQQPVGRAVLFDLSIDAVPTNFAARLRPNVEHDPRFLTYLLSSCYSGGQTRSAIKQTTGIQNLDLGAFLSTRVSVPAQGQQREIADLLDAETARIDALIEKKQRMIDALRERFRTSIDVAVGGTSFLRVRSHVMCRFVRGLSTSQLELNNEGLGVRYLRTSDLLEDLTYSRFDDRYCEDPPPDAVWKSEGELALTIEGFVRPDGRSTIGVACWRGEGLLNNHAVVVRPKDDRVDARFAQYVHATTGVGDALRASAVGAIALSAGGALRDLVMPLPSIEIQRRVAAALDQEQSRVDATVALERRMIALLLERRQSLITAAVTGQLDVSKAA
jgi:type I restriction enzyme S subunit